VFAHVSKSLIMLHDSEWTPFRAAEKRFKARFPLPDLTDVLDLSSNSAYGVDVSDAVRAVAVERVPGEQTKRESQTDNVLSIGYT